MGINVDINTINKNPYKKLLKENSRPAPQVQPQEELESTQLGETDIDAVISNKAIQMAEDYVVDEDKESKEEETSFTPYAMELVKNLQVARERVNSYYSKETQNNLKYPSPEQYIYEKYKDPNSINFRTNMPEDYRDLAYKQELSLLRTGNASQLDDKFALGNASVNVLHMNVNNTVRTQIEHSIEDLFDEYNVDIPKGIIFELEVDPYDFKISAKDINDDELTEEIENALNHGKNGQNLYSHIEFCNPAKLGFDEPSQYKNGDFLKNSLFYTVKDTTGFDIRELKAEEGEFVTPDGKNLWTELEEKVPPNELNKFKGIYKDLAINGWNSTPDYNLSIRCKNGKLYDKETKYGYGDNQQMWQTEYIVNGEPKFPSETNTYKLNFNNLDELQDFVNNIKFNELTNSLMNDKFLKHS